MEKLLEKCLGPEDSHPDVARRCAFSTFSHFALFESSRLVSSRKFEASQDGLCRKNIRESTNGRRPLQLNPKDHQRLAAAVRSRGHGMCQEVSISLRASCLGQEQQSLSFLSGCTCCGDVENQRLYSNDIVT